MRLSILGRYSPFPRAGSACPGYLLRSGEENLLLECGSGVVSRLSEFISPYELDHVVISHLHGDHCSDLAVLKYAANYDVSPGARATRRATDPAREERGRGITVYAPGEPADEFARIPHKDAMRAEAIDESTSLQIGPFHLTFAKTEHPIPCVAVRVKCEGKTLAYTADTALCDSVIDLARGADLLLAEASLPEGCSSFGGHMTASEAGEMALGADVGGLLLTHFWPEADVEAAKHAASSRAHCPVDIAIEGRSYDI